MENSEPIVNKEYLLQKFPGKGGWTYAAIPEVTQNKKTRFGWVKVKGAIDGYPLKQCKLMPMGDGKLFLPVKAAIRKEIRKQEGDFVRIILYPDLSSTDIPEEILLCFENEPNSTYQNFLEFNDNEKKAYLDWIYDAKTEETKAQRIVKMMDRAFQNKKLFDK